MLRQLVSRLGASYTMYVIGSMRGYTEILCTFWYVKGLEIESLYPQVAYD